MATDLIIATHSLPPQSNLLGNDPVLDPLTAARPMDFVRAAVRRNNLFSEALLVMSSTRPKRHARDVLVSVGLHAFILAALILPSLYFTDTIDLKGFAQTFLIAPPPPAPMAQNIAKAVVPRRVLTPGGKLLAPTVIPQNVAMLKEEPLAPDISGGEGVPGGVPGGVAGGVIGGIISGATRSSVPMPVNVSQPTAPLRVGGRVKQPRLISQRQPDYPVLAKQAQVKGIVAIDAVIDRQGNVIEMSLVSGAPLLIQAALDAVRQWKYEPTYLNEQPIEVRLVVRVVFQLNQ